MLSDKGFIDEFYVSERRLELIHKEFKFFDKESDREFIFSHETHMGVPVSRILINGTIYPVLQMLTIQEGLQSFHMDLTTVLEDCWADFEFDATDWAKTIKKIDDLKEWQDELIQISDGYERINETEITSLQNKKDSVLHETFSDVETKILSEYFDYNSSTVKDLSIIDGFRYYRWRYSFNLEIMKFTNNKLLLMEREIF